MPGDNKGKPSAPRARKSDFIPKRSEKPQFEIFKESEIVTGKRLFDVAEEAAKSGKKDRLAILDHVKSNFYLRR